MLYAGIVQNLAILYASIMQDITIALWMLYAGIFAESGNTLCLYVVG